MGLMVFTKGQRHNPCVTCFILKQTSTVRHVETNNTHEHHFVICSPGQTKQNNSNKIFQTDSGFLSCLFVFVSQNKHRKQIRIILPINKSKKHPGNPDYSVEWCENLPGVIKKTAFTDGYHRFLGLK